MGTGEGRLEPPREPPLSGPSAAGLVLAAGPSSRMERDFKLLLPYGGGTVVGASVRAAREAGLRPLVVVTGHRSRAVEEALEAEGLLDPEGELEPEGQLEPGPRGGLGPVRVVHNPRYREGLAASLARGARALGEAPAECVAVLLADEPGIRPESVRRVVEAWRTRPGSVARAVYADRPGHPVVFPRERLGALASLRGDVGAREYLERHRSAVREVRLEGPAPVDVDTRPDYEEALRRA